MTEEEKPNLKPVEGQGVSDEELLQRRADTLQSLQPGEIEEANRRFGEEHSVGVSPTLPTQMMPTNEINQVVSDEGTQIPVRFENGYPNYTDEQGKQLTTGHDISPGSPLVGEHYEHNPEKAQVMAAAGDDSIANSGWSRGAAAEARDLAKVYDDRGQTKKAEWKREHAELVDKVASGIEESAGRAYEEQLRQKAQELREMARQHQEMADFLDEHANGLDNSGNEP